LLLLKSFLRRIWLQYFVLDFSIASLFMIIGISFMVASTIWGGAAWIKSIQTGIPATTGTVMIAVLPFILGFQLLLQAVVLDIQNVPERTLSQFAQARKIVRN
jgi:dolichol-phosphate mannosyltransferase